MGARSSSATRACLLTVLLVSLSSRTNATSQLRSQFCLRQIAGGFHRPVALELHGPHALVAEHKGVIRRVDLASGQHSIAADISGKLLTSSSWMDHRGLLSLRLVGLEHRLAYGNSPKTLLISSSRKSFEGADHDTVLTAVRVTDQGTIQTDGEVELMRVSQPSNRYNGGQILSRPGQLVKANGQGRNSGYEQIIYLTTGDGAMKLNESTRFNEASLTGKILRMKLTERSADEEGFLSKESVIISKPEVFAVGFRNPWRCAIDTRKATIESGLEQLFCGDTAIDPHPEEEIFLVQKGRRYGHPDGGTPLDELPIYKYNLPTGSAVIGGVVYRGEAFKELKDSFVFGDYVSGGIYSLKEGSAGWQVEELPLQLCSTEENNLTGKMKAVIKPEIHVVAFAENQKGELLVLAEDKTKSGIWRGAIFSLEAVSGSSKDQRVLTILQMSALLLFSWAFSEM